VLDHLQILALIVILDYKYVLPIGDMLKLFIEVMEI
jgi:hypothetical protein